MIMRYHWSFGVGHSYAHRKTKFAVDGDGAADDEDDLADDEDDVADDGDDVADDGEICVDQEPAPTCETDLSDDDLPGSDSDPGSNGSDALEIYG
jgi:hypothetical protein